jgi:hypothetical protein
MVADEYDVNEIVGLPSNPARTIFRIGAPMTLIGWATVARPLI